MIDETQLLKSHLSTKLQSIEKAKLQIDLHINQRLAKNVILITIIIGLLHFMDGILK